MAASTVRQIHSIISGALSAAVRWDWLETNPARTAQRPKQKPPEPDPPSPEEAARLLDEAFRADEDWGHAGVAGDDHRAAPGRGLHPALVTGEPGHR
jgi:integrase